MADPTPVLTVRELLLARQAAEARRRAEAEAAANHRKEELRAFTKRLMTYQITDDDKQKALAKIRHAFESNERDVMIAHFPSELCEDQGRRINNHLEGWQDTLPGVLKHVYEWWETELKPGGFSFSARVIDYPNGMPGEIGIFIGWPQAVD